MLVLPRTSPRSSPCFPIYFFLRKLLLSSLRAPAATLEVERWRSYSFYYYFPFFQPSMLLVLLACVLLFLLYKIYSDDCHIIISLLYISTTSCSTTLQPRSAVVAIGGWRFKRALEERAQRFQLYWGPARSGDNASVDTVCVKGLVKQCRIHCISQHRIQT